VSKFPTYDEHYARALSAVGAAYRVLRPPKRIPVSQGAAENLILKRPGDSPKPWSPSKTPYIVEPVDMCASREHKAVCFVGPAQSGKTVGLGEGWIAHNVVNDPGDMLVVQMTEAKAREYSKQRIDRMLLASDNLNALQSTNKRDDNTHDKGFLHGMWLRIAWPTVTNLSSTSYRYVFETDYDRMPDDLDGEGSPFDLALARIRTFLSRGKVVVESSPGRPWLDPAWKPATPHEAPPCSGILGIYNRSDRRRWYWKCPDCREWFEAAPGLGLFNLPEEPDLIEEVRLGDLGKLAKHYAQHIYCPHCESPLAFRHRNELNQNGIWVPDGCRLTRDNERVGDPMTSSIAGFWLGGVAATYQMWDDMLNKHFQGLRDYSLTGDEMSLQTAVNTDQSMPYMSRYLVEGKARRSSPVDRAEKLTRYVVPPETRCVIVAVDVQGGSTARFVAQAHAIGPNREEWLIDRCEIRKSKREGMGDTFAPIDPAGYAEDWDALTEKFILSTYQTPLKDREIRVKLVVVDTGGEGSQNGGEGVTHNAYAWFRRLRKLGVSARAMLYKGDANRKAAIIKEVRVGKRNARDVGDIPLYLCNPHLISDQVSASLKRETPGEGYIHFPKVKHPTENPDGWLPQAFFDELTAEVRSPEGIWQKIRKRNETFDLCRMVRAGMLRLGLDKVNWDNPPDWLKPLEHNVDVISSDERRALKELADSLYKPQAAGREVEVAPKRRARRMSNFLLN
jgi:phage terminase large subunit GpA-like protein